MNLSGETEKLRKLFHDNQQADRSQHPFHNRYRNDCSEPGQFEQTEDHLQHTDDKDDDEQELITFTDMLGIARSTQCNHHRHDRRCQTGSRSGNRHVRSTDKREDKACNDRGNQPDDWWDTRGNRDAR